MSDAPAQHKRHAPRHVGFAIVTVSDTRTATDDASGDLLAQLAQEAGHAVAQRARAHDEPAEILAALDEALAAPGVDAVLLTGGTGIAPRDVTPETVTPRFDKRLPGFGELFRMLSWQDVGSAAMMSRADAGIIRGRIVFLLPGSPKACRLAMERLILPEAGHLVGLLHPARRG